MVEGLRLFGGDLVFKVEYAGAVMQIRLRGAARFPEDGGIYIKHLFGLRISWSVRRIFDFWSVDRRPIDTPINARAKSSVGGGLQVPGTGVARRRH